VLQHSQAQGRGSSKAIFATLHYPAAAIPFYKSTGPTDSDSTWSLKNKLPTTLSEMDRANIVSNPQGNKM